MNRFFNTKCEKSARKYKLIEFWALILWKLFPTENSMLKFYKMNSHLENKILLKKSLENAASEVKTDPLKTEGRKIVQTDGHKVLNIGIWCHTFKK